MSIRFIFLGLSNFAGFNCSHHEFADTINDTPSQYNCGMCGLEISLYNKNSKFES